MANIDWEMEPGDGPTLIQELRNNENSPNRFAAIILLTAFAERDLGRGNLEESRRHLDRALERDPRSVAAWDLRARWAGARGGRARLRAELAAWNPDVVHVNCLPHLDGAAAARATGRPVVWHLREILPPGTRRRWFARALRRDATRLVAVWRSPIA